MQQLLFIIIFSNNTYEYMGQACPHHLFIFSKIFEVSV